MERQKGYATRIIGLSLDECGKMDVNKVLMICDKDKISSEKPIQNNGGVLDNEFINEEEELEQGCWISLGLLYFY